MVFPFKNKKDAGCSDADIMAGLYLQHGPAFERAVACLYGACRDKIMKQLRMQGAGEEDGEDVFQDAMLVLLKSVLDKGIEITNVCGYLYKVAIFIWRKRSSRTLPTVAFDDKGLSEHDGEALQALLEHERLLQIMKQCLLAMTPQCRDILASIYRDDRSAMAEVAQQQQLANPHTARQTKYRCLQKMKACMRSKGAQPD